MSSGNPTNRAQSQAVSGPGKPKDGDDEHGEGCQSNLSAPSRQFSRQSLVQYYGPTDGSCGYCKAPTRGRRTYDMHTYRLTPYHYQILLDRNWRRSGTYSYCPINQTTCCPNYPLSCAAIELQLSRSQRKCVERINSYLINGDIRGKAPIDYHKDTTNKKVHIVKKTETIDQLKSSSKLRHVRFLGACNRMAKLKNVTLEDAMNAIREKWNKKLNPILPLESYLFPVTATLCQSKIQPKHQLRIEMIYVDSSRCKSIREEQQRMIVRYQAAIHKEDGEDWTMSRFCDFLVHSPLIQEPLTNFDYLEMESTDGEATSSIDVNSSRLDKFLLVKPPQLPTTFGTYHCNYHLDDRLIATGVLDVLPKCITTVYFFYDPEFGFLNLGTYSALVEISMVRQMNEHFIRSNNGESNQLVNYHLGFYVPQCKKMHYKTTYTPAYLLCSKTFRYVPIDECLDRLKDKKYADFAEPDDQDAGSSEPALVRALLTVPIASPVESDQVDSRMLSYIEWIERNLGVDHVELLMSGYLAMYAKLVGHELLDKMVIRLDLVHRALVERHKRLTRSRESTADPRR